MSDYRPCPGCDKQLKKTVSDPEKYRKHSTMGRPEPCDFGGTVVVKEEECPSESKSSALSATTAGSAGSPEEGATTVKPATSSTPSSPSSPDTAADASTAAADATPVIPGVTEYATVLDAMSTEQLARYRASVDASVTHFAQPAPQPHPEQPTLFEPAPAAFSQPAGRRSEAPAIDMTELGKEITARVKETFYAYQNRKTSDNRGAQATMGPSEMGTPCPRRLALSLMRMPPVNPGSDGWASFVGTCVHAGLEEMFRWADGGTGRYATETALKFDNKYVPRGTGDLLDRTLMMFLDHKAQGRWSRNKLRSSGPSELYLTQVNVYAYGARQRGEKVDHVGIISWPRDESTLDDLYVWTAPYDPSIVKAAFERVDRIGDRVGHLVSASVSEKAAASAEFDVAPDCRFCKFHLPGARSIQDGCNGKR